MQLVLLPSLVHAQSSAPSQLQLDTTTFVVLGDGLAAGMANTGLLSMVQNKSFPAQMVRQMGTGFPQPSMQDSGVGDPLGYPPLPVRAPTYPEGTRRIFP